MGQQSASDEAVTQQTSLSTQLFLSSPRLLDSYSVSFILSLSLFLIWGLPNTRISRKWFCSWQLSVAIWGI